MYQFPPCTHDRTETSLVTLGIWYPYNRGRNHGRAGACISWDRVMFSLSDKGKWEIKFLCDFFYSWVIIIPPLYLPTGSEKSLYLCALVLSATDMFILFHKKRVIGNSLFFEPLACQWTKLLISSGQDKYLIPLRGKPTQRIDRRIIRLFFSGWRIWSSHRERSIDVKNVRHSYLILGNMIRDFFCSDTGADIIFSE